MKRRRILNQILGGLAGLIAGTGLCMAASTPVAHFEMGEQELSGGTGVGATPAALINSVSGGVNIPLGAGTAPIVAAPSPAPGSTHAMDFSGRTGYFQVADNLIHSTSGFCVEGWARANNSPQVGGTTIDGVFSYGHGGVGYIVAQHGANWDVFVGGSGWKNITAPVSAAAWTHLAIAKGPDNSQVTLYVDGVAKGSFAATGVAGGCAIGDQYTNGGHRFDGQIDDVWFSSVTGSFNPVTDLHRTLPTDPVIVMPSAPVAAGTVGVSTTGTAYADIDNAGTTNTLTISAVTALSGDTGKFTLVTPLPLNIPPGEMGTLEFTYAPGATAGSHNAVFTVTNNDANNTSPSLTLTGTAITDPNLIVPSSLAFGAVSSTATTSKIVQLANSAFNNDLNVSLAIVGTDAAKFSIVDPNPPNSAIAPGASLNVEVACAPGGFLGALSASLQITHNDPDLASPLLVSLTANSVPRYSEIAHYRLGESDTDLATTVDDTGDLDLTNGNGTPGTSYNLGAGVAGSSKGIDNALDDVYSHAGIPAALTDRNQNWGMEAWIRPELATGSAQMGGGYGGLYFGVGNGSRGGFGIFSIDGSHWGLNVGGVSAPSSVALIHGGTWTHVAAVALDNQIRLYVNGVLAHTYSGLGFAPNNTGGNPAQIELGGQTSNSWRTAGGLDEARLFTFVSGQFNPATDLHVTPPADADGDDLDDAWEDQYFGDNNGTVIWTELAVTDGSGDADGDGFSDQAEHDAGTDPQDENSFPATEPLAITSISKAGNTATVAFEGIDGGTYVLKKSLTLNDGFPVSCGTVTLSGTNNGLLQDTSATEPKAFYRVEKE
jgi:hypothetical protein